VNSPRSIEYLIFDGEYFEVEFYFDENGQMPAKNEFNELNDNEKAAFLARVSKLGDSSPGIIHPRTIFNLEDDKEKIFAIKFGNNRFCSFFFEGSKIIITNSYKKQTQKNTKREKEQIKKAIESKKDYASRRKSGIYYKG
jgi:phage-related protein